MVCGVQYLGLCFCHESLSLLTLRYRRHMIHWFIKWVIRGANHWVVIWWHGDLWICAATPQPRGSLENCRFSLIAKPKWRWTVCPRLHRDFRTTMLGTITRENSVPSRTSFRPGWRRGKLVPWISLTWWQWTSSTSKIQVCYASYSYDVSKSWWFNSKSSASPYFSTMNVYFCCLPHWGVIWAL